MKKSIVEGGFYRIIVGQTQRKVFIKDLKMIKKLKKKKSPALPKY